MSGNTYHIGIEMGGTTCKIGYVCSSNPNEIIAKHIVPSEKPEATINAMAAWILKQPYMFSSFGIASFGPICVDESSSEYGFITNTPKPNWKYAPVLKLFSNALKPKLTSTYNYCWDTDCNVLAEFLAKPNEQLCYITIGTGVGIGLVIGGKPVHGMMHPEGGHVRVIPHPDDTFEGCCPFHGNCIEGMCNNISIMKRLKLKSVHEVKNVSPDHPVWTWIAYQLGAMIGNIALTTSIHRCVIGGGIINSKGLLGKIEKRMEEYINGYIPLPKVERSDFGDNLGLVSACVQGMKSDKTMSTMLQSKL